MAKVFRSLKFFRISRKPIYSADKWMKHTIYIYLRLTTSTIYSGIYCISSQSLLQCILGLHCRLYMYTCDAVLGFVLNKVSQKAAWCWSVPFGTVFSFGLCPLKHPRSTFNWNILTDSAGKKCLRSAIVKLKANASVPPTTLVSKLLAI